MTKDLDIQVIGRTTRSMEEEITFTQTDKSMKECGCETKKKAKANTSIKTVIAIRGSGEKIVDKAGDR